MSTYLFRFPGKAIALSLDGNFTGILLGLIEQAIERGFVRWRQHLPSPEAPAGAEKRPHQDLTATTRKVSGRAIFSTDEPPTKTGLLLNTSEVSELLAVSPRTVWSMQVSGKMPAPIRIGRAVRWSYAAIKKWVDDGCPDQND